MPRSEDSGEIINFSKVNTIVAGDIDFPGFTQAEYFFCTIVKPEWVFVSVEKQALARTQQYSPNPKSVLADVNVTAIGLPQGDKQTIYAGVTALGGCYSDTLLSTTTHIVATDTENSVCQAAQAHGLDCKLVTPQWAADCFSLSRKVDEHAYEINQTSTAYKSSIDATDIYHDAEHRYLHNRSKVLPMPRQPTLKNKSIILGSDLELSPEGTDTVKFLINLAGGQVVDFSLLDSKDLSSDTILLCQYRDCAEYELCFGRCFIGNLSWLYYTLANNRLENPVRRPLHYPLVRYGMPCFRDKKISLTGFLGESRLYLRSLIEATGAKYANNLTPQVDYLIAGNTSSAKFYAARMWNVHVVNHLWLEECYALWSLRSVSLPRYSAFPNHVNFSSILGQTALSSDILHPSFIKNTNDAPPEDSSFTTNPQIPSVAVEASKLSDVNSTSPRSYGDEALPDSHTRSPDPSESRDLSDEQQNISAIGNASPGTSCVRGDEHDLSLGQSAIDVGESASSPSRTSTGLSPPTHPADESNLQPSKDVDDESTSSASPTRKSGTSSVLVNEKDAGTSTCATTEPTEPTLENAPKKRKLPEAPSAKTYDRIYLLTGVSGTLKQKSTESKLKKLGIQFTDDPVIATTVVAPGPVKTTNFLSALAQAKEFISDGFLIECLTAKCHLEKIPDQYLLNSMAIPIPTSASLLLSHTLLKASERRASGDLLFKGHTAILHRSVKPSGDLIRLVCAHGGSALQLSRSLDFQSAAHNTIILISEVEESAEIDHFIRQMQSFKAMVHRRCKSWLIQAIFLMELDIETHNLLAS